ncbi:PAS domain S-box protein [Desulfococcaceae bacterium HSG7]|nr:PAS domain S-box protein [Desulfococcaceae bacterium HSG7]
MQEEKRFAELLRKVNGMKNMPDIGITELINELQADRNELESQNKELRQQKEKLEESRRKYYNLYDSAPVGYFTFNKDGMISDVNLAGAELLGQDRDTLIDNYFYHYIDACYHDTFSLHRKQIFTTRTRQTCKIRLKKKDNPQFYVLLESVPDKDSKGNFTLFRTVMNDITESVETEEALQKAYTIFERKVKERLVKLEKTNAEIQDSESKLLAMLESVGDCMSMIDKNLTIIWANEIARQLFGNNIIGQKCYTAFHNSDEPCSPQPCHVLKAFEDRKIHRHETRTTDKNGKIRYLDCTANVALYDQEENPKAVLEIARDITMHKILEKELLKSQKLESVGRLAGGIAHDFNNLLTAILGNISLVKKHLPSENKFFEMADQAENATLQASDLANRLITFSKGGEPLVRTVSAGKLLKKSVNFALSGSNVKCDFSVPGDLWSIEADEGQIGQVIQNIISNAKEAMPIGGIVTVGAENITDALEDLPFLKQEKYIRISITDQGEGIPEKNIDKIFEPYFSTKKAGTQKGMGLGLAICYSIVKKHQGYITVDSEAVSGATFYIYLPASEAIIEKKEEETTPAKDGIHKATGTVLVMDDEELIRLMAGDMLKIIGYQVALASDGEEAITLYKEAKESGNPFDAVILDLTIRGGMGGLETIKKLLAIDPDVKAIVSSGYYQTDEMREFSEYGFKDVMPKPYNIQQIGTTLNRLLQKDT